MGGSVKSIGRFFAFFALGSVLLSASSGCQVAPNVSVKQLVAHRDISNLDGLDAAERLDDLKVSWAIPGRWEALTAKKTALYTHQQWKSPSNLTGVGVAHIKLPLPIPASAVVWLAKNEYLRRATSDQEGGKLIGQWTDALGRQWFEAENSKYHVRGYAMSRGNEAWIVYSGWRVTHNPRPYEITLAKRSLESVVPMTR